LNAKINKPLNQIIRELSDELIFRLESQRTWVRDHYENNAVEIYNTLDGKLELLDFIIKSNWIAKTEKYKLQCLGVTLGDALVQELEFKWIEIEDEYGNDPAIKYKDTSLILFPLTMISKRIENDEYVDVFKLFEQLKSKVIELKDRVDKK
jgi:hypothetical protein